MKVLALNSSPRTSGQSKTKLMLDHLVEGMRDAGAAVEVVDLRKKKIKVCIGCYTCWTKTPGQCLQKDDMTNELLPKWLDVDLAVYATPLYNYAVNATLKAFIERTLPSFLPYFEFIDGRMYHPLRVKNPGIVMLSVAGMPDEGHFDPLSMHMIYLLGSPGRNLVAEIYRTSSELMTNPLLADKAEEILAATRQAGRELAESQQITPGTMEKITQPFQDPETFAKIANLHWQTCIDEGVTPRESAKLGLMPRPNSIETFLLIMSMGFNPEGAGDTKAVIQFEFTGEVSGGCYLDIADGAIKTGEGLAETSDMKIIAPFEVWMDVTTKKIEGAQALFDGKYQVEGNTDLLMNMGQLFGRSSD